MVVPHTFPDKMYKMLLCGVKVQSIRGLFTKNDDTKGVSYFELFRFATSFEYFLIFLAVVFTALKAFTFPVMVLIYGEFTTLLIERTYRNGTSSKTYYLQLFGGGRVLDIERIRDAIGEKVSHFLHLLFAFLILISFAFSHGWKLTLVVISYTPFLFASNSIAARFQTLFSTKESDAGAVASSVSEEVLGGIRTVVAFGGEEKEKQRYSELLLPAQKAALRRAASTGIGEGIMKFLILGSNSLAYWFGFLLVFADRNDIDKEYTSAVLMIVFLDLGIGGDFLYMMKPFLESFAIARGAAATVFKIIDRKSKIDPMSKSGGIINLRGEGDIEFQDVGFSYPSRTDTKILNRLNVKFMNGQTVALVGSSGNGKSTCLQLLQRFYDPTEGRILIDGHDIKDLNLSWWRSNIAFVGQEPALFATTIEENIRYANPNATRNEIEVSAKLAGAHHFITQLQDGYETLVGERGCQLSGGQKQRIAIARALIKNPKILLLDEATSALDSHSEKLVQDALNKASKGRTTIVVSHRLSAIYNADKILFIENGRVVEAGTHDELINLKGSYYKMMRSNKKGSENALQTAVDDDAIPKDKIERFILGFQQPQDSRKEAAIAKTELRVWSVLKRILLMAKPERSFFMVAIIAAIVIGLGSAVPSIFFGEFFAALGKVDSDETRETVRFISFGFVALGITMGFMAFLRIYMINKGGVFLVSRVQTKAFNAMMSQEMAWFDDVDNSVGALSARLTGDASNIRSTIGYPLCEMMHLAFGLVFGMAVSFFYSWKLALVVSPITPLIILTVFVEKKCTENAEEASKQGIAEIVRVATESILNIRTVTSLRQEPHMIARYSTEADKDEKEIRKKLSFRGAIYSIGQIIPLIAYVISVTYGGTLVADEGLNSKALIIVSEAMLISFYMLGEMLVFSPAITSALYAAHSLFQIIDRQSRVKAPAYSPVIHDVSRKQDEKSDILFKQIRFNYPTRPNINILQNLNLNILEGKTVALVGPSGCGKSTCVQLLQRLYDPDDGQIFIGSDEISRDLTLKELRSKLSIVSQEPILFDRTIGENIAYGDNSRIVVTADIVEAAKMANIHDFIAALPLGYDTRIGSKGTQLSGGQKQRIAIARALVRNPKVLLLDEATSALDIASEKIVQTALDLARTGRTCLVIAHRLSTVENADLICVIQNGIVHEQGTHQQLLTLDGLYSKLYAMEPKA